MKSITQESSVQVRSAPNKGVKMTTKAFQAAISAAYVAGSSAAIASVMCAMSDVEEQMWISNKMAVSRHRKPPFPHLDPRIERVVDSQIRELLKKAKINSRYYSKESLFS